MSTTKAFVGKISDWLITDAGIEQAPRRLLIVDDDHLVRRVLRRTLVNTDIDLTLVSSQTEALEAVDRETFQVVISDYRMKGMNGLDLLQEIRLRSPSTILLLMSGSAYIKDALDAVEHNWLFDFVVKPWSPDSLKATISRAFAQHEATERLVRLTSNLSAPSNEEGADRYQGKAGIARLINSFVMALVKVGDLCSKESPAHSRRLALFSAILCEKLDVPESVAKAVECAALLHDLGNLCGVAATLDGSRPSQDEDAASFSSHPLYAHHVVRDVPGLGDVATIVLQHHERWDGKGYPSGLRGSSIHLGARILCVAEAYDSMTSEDRFHPALSSAAADAEIQASSGQRFDPAVVEAWRSILESEKAMVREIISEVPLPIAKAHSPP